MFGSGTTLADNGAATTRQNLAKFLAKNVIDKSGSVALNQTRAGLIGVRATGSD